MRFRHAVKFTVPAFLASALTLTLAPSSVGVDGPFPEAGRYKTQGGPTTLYDDGDVLVAWDTSRVFKWEGGIPTRWQVNVTYFNRSDESVNLTCGGWDTDQVRETIYREGKSIGYVSAERDLCSENPDWNKDLGPNETVKSWAIFHNVPWLGDRVELQWGDVGTSQQLNPFGARIR
ncbi:hypothetical protein [Streptomyces scabiei]|uniref:hypothetical protein n=1 Tax=Streptomyces scabiei TaxID=1930 RepID=UPI000765D586|nr:hypothetical protein [Streptomyces scabiei]